MSFSLSFTAATKSMALQKLHEAYAPGAVKAIIEQAIAALPAPKPQTEASTDGAAKVVCNGYKQPTFLGVRVEAYGHIDEGYGETTIGRLSVLPLFD